MPLVFSDQHKQQLSILEFTQRDLIALAESSKEDFIKRISKRRRSLSLKYHPDKNSNKSTPEINEKFLLITKAYEILAADKTFQPDFLDFIERHPVDIDLNAIDQFMEDYIDDSFEKIQNMALHLKEDNKEAFITKYADFINIALWLNENRVKIHENRLEKFYLKTAEPSLQETVYHEFNSLVIELFGQEGLDDITYREAIALGHYENVMSLYKLLSPIKWLCFGINSAYNAITTTLSYIMNLIIQTCLLEINAFKLNQNRSLYDYFLISLKVVLSISLVVIPLVLIPIDIMMLLLALPLITKLLLYLANPVNKVIRPIADYLKMDNLIITLCAIPLIAVMGLALYHFLAISSSLNAILFISDVCSYLSFACYLYTLKLMYDLNPELAVFILLINISGFIFSEPGSDYVITNLIDALIVLTANLGMLGINSMVIFYLENLNNELSTIYSLLPMPETPLASSTKNVIIEGNTVARYSHKFFNTGNNEKVNSYRANPHPISSFFGLDSKRGEHVDDEEITNSEVKLICT